MKVAILGYAAEGQSAYEHWKNGNDITICDENTEVNVPDGASSQLGVDYLKNLDKFDILVRTPALHPARIIKANPDSPDILDKVTSVTNEFLKLVPTKNLIGVTGTKGKGTTSTLIAKMLEEAGKNTHLGGNIGTPLLNLLDGTEALHGDAMQGAGEARTESYTAYDERALESATQQSAPSSGSVAGSAGQQDRALQGIQANDWVVMELSSFQLIDLKTSPHIGVCLMVEPEHLDWHPDLDEYLDAKSQLFINQSQSDIAIYFAGNKNSEAIADASEGKRIPYFAKPGAIVADGKIQIDGRDICQTSELKLLGEHNWQNACAAVTAVWQVTQDVEAIHKVLTTFTGLEHRLELVREMNGVKYYDDSFGTTPETATVAVRAFKEPKVLILGGSVKGSSFDDLADTIAKSDVRQVILIGNTSNPKFECATPQIEKALRKAGVTNIISTVKDGGSTMTEIVKLAQEQAKPGDVVLLSTGCASFDMFKNYKDRAEQFSRAVLALA